MAEPGFDPVLSDPIAPIPPSSHVKSLGLSDLFSLRPEWSLATISWTPHSWPLLLRSNGGGWWLGAPLSEPNGEIKPFGGYHFLTPRKVIPLFLPVKRFCFPAKPARVRGTRQCVNGFTVFQQLLGAKHTPHTWQNQGLGGGSRQHLGSPQLHPDPEPGERRRARTGSGPPLPPPRQSGKAMRMLCAWRGDSPKNTSSLKRGPSPLGTEPGCPAVSEITPAASQGVSIVTRAFGPQVAPMGPGNSSHNSLLRDREAGSETGSCDSNNQEDCVPKNFCPWLRRTLCVRRLWEISKFRPLSNSKLNT